MIGKIAGTGLYNPLTIETTLDPKIQPFLHDHQIDGTPVLPGVMGIEAFAEAALRMLPGWHVAEIEDVNFLAPFKFYRNEPRTLTVEALIHPHRDGVVADCRLIGLRRLPNQTEPQSTTHFTARVWLTKQPPEVVTTSALTSPAGHSIEAADIYRLYFHGPAYQVLERAWWDGSRIVGLMAKNLAEQSPAFGTADADGAAADRALLPNRRRLGDGRARAVWACRSTLIVSLYCDPRIWRKVGCTLWSLPIRLKEVSTVRLWIWQETVTCNSGGTAPWRFRTILLVSL